MTDDECAPLSVLFARTGCDRPVVVSCWKISQEELDEIRRTKRIWLVVYGETMPPIAVAGTKPFSEVK